MQTHVGSWEVLALPGHGADQIGMFNRRLGYLLSADLAFPGLPSYLEYGTRPDPHADQLRSLQSAIALGPELLLPGHGRPTPDAVAVLQRCHALVLERVDRVLATIEHPGMTGWDVAVALTPPGALNDHTSAASPRCCPCSSTWSSTVASAACSTSARRRVWAIGED